MYNQGEKGHYEFKLYCNAEQSAVTKVSVKLPLAVVTAFAKHKQQKRWVVCAQIYFVLSVQSHIFVQLIFFLQIKVKRGMLIDSIG